MPSESDAKLSKRLVHNLMKRSGANMIEVLYWIAKNPRDHKTFFTPDELLEAVLTGLDEISCEYESKTDLVKVEKKFLEAIDSRL